MFAWKIISKNIDFSLFEVNSANCIFFCILVYCVRREYVNAINNFLWLSCQGKSNLIKVFYQRCHKICGCILHMFIVHVKIGIQFERNSSLVISNLWTCLLYISRFWDIFELKLMLGFDLGNSFWKIIFWPSHVIQHKKVSSKFLSTVLLKINFSGNFYKKVLRFPN